MTPRLASVAALVSAAVLACAGCGRVGFASRTIADAGEPPDVGDVGDVAADASPDALQLATPALVQGSGAVSVAATTVSAMFATDVHAGNTLIVGCDVLNTAPLANLVSLTDTLGSTFAIDVGPYNGAEWITWIWSAPLAASGPDTITVVFDQANDSPELRIHELSGVATAGAFDTGSTTSSSEAAGSFDAAPITTTSPNELVFAIVVSGIVNAGSGYAVASMVNDDLAEYMVATTPGTYTADATLVISDPVSASVAAYRAGPAP